MQTVPIINAFKRILGESNLAVGRRQTEHYRKGWRSGEGEALAVLFPHTLMQYWEVLKVCVEYDCIIIMQAAKTGLTEGSTPSGDDYDRPVVVINTLAMDSIVLINGGKQVLSFPGATLFQLEKALKPLGRAPHSVIGSSCLGASIVGGVANNSGGALIKRGPAYTELSLFAQVEKNGELKLVNHLGIDLGDTPEEIIGNLSSGNFPKSLPETDKKASANDYEQIVRDVNADTPSRFNADPTRLYEASGCAGKVAVFAVRLDTFDIPKKDQTFYIGTNDPDVLTRIRRDILTQFKHLPEVGEYIHREMFDIADVYGKDTILSIQRLGTDSLPKLFALKGRVDAVFNKLPFIPRYLSDRVMQFGSKLFSDQIPPSLRAYRDKYEHHLILKMSDGGIEEASTFLAKLFTEEQLEGDYITCNEDEALKAFLLRFAAAGAAVRYQMLHHKRVGDILALDIALRRNDEFWAENLPEHIAKHIEKPLYYGHFFCHVFHQDYILKKDSDAKKVKADMLALLDSRGAKYPAEHNVGHLYEAEASLQKFYKELDPTNTFNSGIGKMEKHKRNCSCCL
ncbi:D-lactate dehydrogenase [Alteromonas abrolhosensis]|uniref:D-lactate dehydrogenase n=1 Tax=Alteromonas abrolhosensis TaxID=1892904 RepID=UPI00096B949A|nr:D-lactate dehydrogenase [Alteromonas abrolhosensis]|tara:strand:+ start:60 stop:1763 length:1704 start_codon:yes stop_codon:yes gene_type:complete